MKKVWKATFIITLEGEKTGIGEGQLTSQMARDKLLVPCQEMWITRNINKFSIEEVKPMRVTSTLSHGNEPGKRESFYKTGFPGKKRPNE